MSDPSAFPDLKISAPLETDLPSTTGIPRWVKAFVVVIVVLVGVMVVLHLTGHNLMNHLPPTQPGAP